MNKRNKIALYFHYLVSMLMMLLPFLFRWQICVFIYAVTYLQILLLKRCFLTILEYGTNEGPMFMDNVFAKYGLVFTPLQRRVLVFLQFLALSLISMYLGLVVGFKPLIF